MKNVTCGQKEQLSVLFRRGQLSGLPVRNPAELSEAAAARLIVRRRRCRSERTGWFPNGCARRLLKLRESKRVRFEDCELEFMTEDIAMGLFWVAGRQEYRDTGAGFENAASAGQEDGRQRLPGVHPKLGNLPPRRRRGGPAVAEGERKVAALLEK